MLPFDQPENAVYVGWYRQEVRVEGGRGGCRCLTALFSNICVPISSSCLSLLFFWFLFSKDILTDKLFSESFRISISFSRRGCFLLYEKLKISFFYIGAPHVWFFPAKEGGVLMMFSSNMSLCGAQISLNTMHIRAGKDKNCAFAFNPRVILLLLSFTPIAWGVKILHGKEGSSLASSLVGFTEHEEEVCEKLSGWLTAFTTQLPGSLPLSSLLKRRTREKWRENVADQAVL